jgi:hypothetical protein
MGTTNTQVTTPGAGGSSCHGTGQGTRGWLGGRRGIVIAAVVAVAATALALGQHWLAVANLVPLLFVLPCAVMMFMCMKGNHGQQTNGPPASTQGGTPSITDTRN